MSFLYFAYGSNMLSSRLIARCPSATVIGTGTVQNHSLKFSKRSMDGSGKATLVEQSFGIHTPGVLYEIDTKERDALDRAEGAGKGYDRVDEFRVDTSDETVTATTYLATELHNGLIPFDWYLALVIAGTLEHELGDNHAARLREIACKPDDNLGRKSRLQALEALSAHGHSDHLSLL